jgi:hypothetical protein
LLAHVVVSKYVDHLPRYRLEQIFAREKIDLSRTTLCEWVAAVATALTPIGEQLRREITATDYLQTDDTSITVLDERGGSYKGRLWTYLDPIGRQVVFDATPTHERDGPDRFLADFRGKLQASAANFRQTRIVAMTHCTPPDACSKSDAGTCAPSLRRGLHDRHDAGADDCRHATALRRGARRR